MSNIKIFENKEFGQVRTVTINEEPYFVGKDVAEILGYAETANMRKLLETDEYKEINPQSTEYIGFVQNGCPLESNVNIKRMLLISEGGLYQAIFNSTLPNAKQFKRWVTSEVLPSIRKHGGYLAGQEQMTEDELIAKALVFAQNKINDLQKRLDSADIKVSRLTVATEVMRPKAEYFDELVDRNCLTSFTDTAKEFGVPPRKFTQFLLDKKYIYRDKKGKLVPYENEKAKDLFVVKECYNDKTRWSGVQTLVTPKGKETFRLLCQAI